MTSRWRTAQLADFAALVSTGPFGSILHKSDYVDSGVPLVNPVNIIGDHIEPDPKKLISGQTAARLASYILEAGDIVVARRGEIGRCAVVGPDERGWVCGTGCFFIRPLPTVNPHFLARLIRSDKYREKLVQAATGSTMLNLSNTTLGNLPVSIPPLEEQRRIVDILDRAASIRRLRRQAQKTARQIVPALFHKMFGNPVNNPMGWRVAPLKTVANVASGVTKGRRLDGAEAVDVPYMRVANVQDGFLDLGEVKTIPLRPSEVDRFRLLPGDMLMTEGGDPDKLGRGAIWTGQIPYCAHQNHVFRVRADRTRILPHFLACLSGSAYGKGYFLRVAKRTTGIASINKTQLSAFPVFLPPVPLQEEFEQRVDEVTGLVGRQRVAEAACEAAAQAIQSRLFSV